MTTMVAPEAHSGFLGSLPEARKDVLAMLEHARAAHGDLVWFRIGPRLRNDGFLGVFDPHAAHQTLGPQWTEFRKDNPLYAELRASVGDGLLTSQDDVWQRQRRLLAPLFTPKRVGSYLQTISDVASETAQHWLSGTVDLHREIGALTLASTTRILFGRDASTLAPLVGAEYPVLAGTVFDRAYGFVRLPRSVPTPANLRLRRAEQRLRGACDALIAGRRASGAGDDLLGRLLVVRDDGTALSDTEIREQVLIFLLAGFETTASAITFALYLIAGRPGIQQRVRDEARAVLDGDEVPDDALSRLEYTTQVVKEALRLYPPGALVGRQSVDDTSLSGTAVPAGSAVMVAPWVIHRHPEFWPDPLRFDPERFAPDAVRAHDKHAFLPFGLGPRICIGNHFATAEMVLAVARIVRDIELSAPDRALRVTMHVTLRPTDPVRVQVRRI